MSTNGSQFHRIAVWALPLLLLLASAGPATNPTSNPTPRHIENAVFDDYLISGGTSETYAEEGQTLTTGNDTLEGGDWGGWGCILTWQFLYSSEAGDVYRFKRTFWWKGGNLDVQTKEITYTGKRIVIFENKIVRFGMQPGMRWPTVATRYPDRWGGLSAQTVVLSYIIAVLAVAMFLRLTASRKRAAEPNPVSAIDPADMSKQVLQYASPGILIRHPAGWLDWFYLLLVVGCYILATYADSIMPGGANWSFDWEYASFLMTVAALSGIVLCFAGLVRVIVHGRRRCPIVILVGVWMGGALPVLLLPTRWLQNNFA